MQLNFSFESYLLPLNSIFVLVCLEWGTDFVLEGIAKAPSMTRSYHSFICTLIANYVH
jgi:hypothetical protein